ncbi:DUF4013 domain-containing protein [uncultured Methanobrevibacter sp.]|uniref:DUF4013 domain-containing protein n=1 Tax=uncultured Methanobrevibacter sp. TaxID=253161 RepID=UPI0025F6A508|nr:DUF4013 domain-containing protein [uncultured Methanobrevibacter sp.]
MNLRDILKNAFIFPSKNLETLSTFAILLILSSAFAFEGIVTCIFGVFDIWNLVIGAICIIIAIIIGLNTRKISIQCIKSGIDLEEKLPDFNWWQNLSTGLNKVIITIFYFIIPALLVVAVAFITNLIGSIITIIQGIITVLSSVMIGDVISGFSSIYHASYPLLISLSITLSACMIIFLIFSFFQAMGEARLAHTGSLKNALNIVGAARDISRIGVGKLILLSALLFVIMTVIQFILTVICNQLPVLTILFIIVTPYLELFSQRSLGLLYSDIV